MSCHTNAGPVVVTGAFGFIGRRLLLRLRQGAPDRSIIALGHEHAPENLPDSVSAIVLDLEDEGRTASFLAEIAPDMIIHLAGQASVVGAGISPWPAWKTNVGATLSLAEAFLRVSPAGTFIFASSAEVYGRSFEGGGALTEDALLQPANAYARGKVAAEYGLRDLWAGSLGKLVIARIFNHIGAGQSERFVASSFAAQLARMEVGISEPLIRVGNLHVERDFGHIDDLTEALALLAERVEALESGAVFNICSGRPRSILGVLEGLISLSRVRPEVRVEPDLIRPGELQRVLGSHEALRAATGWRPRRRIEDALRDVLADWRVRIAAAS